MPGSCAAAAAEAQLGMFPVELQGNGLGKMVCREMREARL